MTLAIEHTMVGLANGYPQARGKMGVLSTDRRRVSRGLAGNCHA